MLCITSTSAKNSYTEIFPLCKIGFAEIFPLGKKFGFAKFKILLGIIGFAEVHLLGKSALQKYIC
jgi:hypothetical protein